MKQYVFTFVSIFLLGVYIYSVYFAVKVAWCVDTSGCTEYTVASFHANFVTAMNAIGGLISALVVGVLALTPPNTAPSASSLGVTTDPKNDKYLKLTTSLYILGWLVTGVVAFLIGVLKRPDALKPLTDLGWTWFGFAVAAAYAYFGIKPEEKK
jgi:hypothetical protein